MNVVRNGFNKMSSEYNCLRSFGNVTCHLQYFYPRFLYCTIHDGLYLRNKPYGEVLERLQLSEDGLYSTWYFRLPFAECIRSLLRTLSQELCISSQAYYLVLFDVQWSENDFSVLKEKVLYSSYANRDEVSPFRTNQIDISNAPSSAASLKRELDAAVHYVQ